MYVLLTICKDMCPSLGDLKMFKHHLGQRRSSLSIFRGTGTPVFRARGKVTLPSSPNLESSSSRRRAQSMLTAKVWAFPSLCAGVLQPI